MHVQSGGRGSILGGCRKLANTEWVDSENKNIRRVNELYEYLNSAKLSNLPDDILDTSIMERSPNLVVGEAEAAARGNRLNRQTLEALGTYLHVRPPGLNCSLVLRLFGNGCSCGFRGQAISSAKQEPCTDLA